ncbi:hypothetical protein [Proteus mirabilis]|uniref:hypothetical protein n=1 Tax=Proteus mirabilis TaxID=584 RepID=UPI0039B60810
MTRYEKSWFSVLAEYLIIYGYSETHEKLGMVTPKILQMIVFGLLFFKINSLILS